MVIAHSVDVGSLNTFWRFYATDMILLVLWRNIKNCFPFLLATAVAPFSGF